LFDAVIIILEIYVKKSAFIALAAVVVLSACVTTTPSILSANDAGITLQVRANNVANAEKEAQAYCATKGRTAVLDRVTPNGKDANVSYYCR
jgi:putative hemolysin